MSHIDVHMNWIQCAKVLWDIGQTVNVYMYENVKH